MNAFTISTADSHSRHHILVHDEVNYFEFYVRTCANARVYLSSEALSEDILMYGYEVIFGDEKNTKVTVLKHPGPTPVAQYVQAEIVSCHAERYVANIKYSKHCT